MPEHLKIAQADASEEARSADTLLEDRVAAFVREAVGSFTLEDVARHAGMVKDGDVSRVSMGDTKRLGLILRHMGYEKARERDPTNPARRGSVRWMPTNFSHN